MSVKSRFKWNRAPNFTPGSGPVNWVRNSTPPMRQIAGKISTLTSGGGGNAIFTAFVPANSWGLGKMILIRGIYSLVLPAGPFLFGYSISESMNALHGINQVLPVSTFPAPAPGTYTTYIERCYIRDDPNILCFDRGDCMQHNWANKDDNISHVLTMGPVAGPFNYTQSQQLDLFFQLPVAPLGATITGIWIECLMEQAINLGTLA